MLVLTRIICGVELCNSFVWKFSKFWMRQMEGMDCEFSEFHVWWEHTSTHLGFCSSVQFLFTVQLQAPCLLLLKLPRRHAWSLIHKKLSCALGERWAYFGLLQVWPESTLEGFLERWQRRCAEQLRPYSRRPIEAMAWLHNARKVPALPAVAEAAFSVQVGFLPSTAASLTSVARSLGTKRASPPISFQNALLSLFLLLEACCFFFLLLFL